jgi:hypothetical protein
VLAPLLAGRTGADPVLLRAAEVPVEVLALALEDTEPDGGELDLDELGLAGGVLPLGLGVFVGLGVVVGVLPHGLPLAWAFGLAVALGPAVALDEAVARVLVVGMLVAGVLVGVGVVLAVGLALLLVVGAALVLLVGRVGVPVGVARGLGDVVALFGGAGEGLDGHTGTVALGPLV